MRRPQQMIDIREGGLAERAQCLALDYQHVLAHDFLDSDAANVEFPVWCPVRTEWEQRRMFVGRNDIGGGVHGKNPRKAGSPAGIAPPRANGKPACPVLEASPPVFLPQTPPPRLLTPLFQD